MIITEADIHEIQDMAFKQVVEGKFSQASYRYYWITKFYISKENLDPFKVFKNFQNYILCKIKSNDIFYITVDSAGILSRNKSQITMKNRIPNYKPDFEKIKTPQDIWKLKSDLNSLAMLKSSIYSAIWGNPLSEFKLPIFNFSPADLEKIQSIQDYFLESNNSFGSTESAFRYYEKKLLKTISVLNEHSPDKFNGRILKHISSLFYYLGVITFIEHFWINLIQELDLRKNYLFQVDFSTLNNNLLIGSIIFPLNYQISSLRSIIHSLYNKGESQTAVFYLISMFLLQALHTPYLNEGSRLNSTHEFDEAERMYFNGIGHSFIGNIYDLFYNAALNAQSILTQEDVPDNIVAFNNSVAFCEEALFDIQIGIFNFLGINSVDSAETIIARNNQFLMNIYGVLGTIYYDARTLGKINLHNAIEMYNKGLSYKDDNGDIYSNRSLAYIHLGEWDNAIKDAFSALDNHAQYPSKSYLNLAKCFFEKEDYTLSKKYASQVLEISATDHSKGIACNTIGLANYNLGNYNLAIQYYKKSLKNTPDDFSNYQYIGDAYKKLGDFPNALDFYGMSAQKGDVQSHYYIGQVYSELEDKKSTKESFKKYIEMSINRYFDQFSESYEKAITSEIFYKYKTINKNTIESLLQKYLYFSRFEQLNDPFDGRLINEMLTDAAFKMALEELGIPGILSISMQSDLNKQSLMWSHYADEHKGVRIGYKFSAEELRRRKILISNVIYEKELDSKKVKTDWRIEEKSSSNGNLQRNMNVDEEYSDELRQREKIKSEKSFFHVHPYASKDFIKNLITKGIDWEYEKEFRLIHFGNQQIVYKGNSNLFEIVEITFGYRTLENDIRSIIKLIISQKKEKYPELVYKDNGLFKGEDLLVSFGKLKMSSELQYGLEPDESFYIKDYLEDKD